jgi:phage tail-like protein
MARSSQKDPIDKFRFSVTILVNSGQFNSSITTINTNSNFDNVVGFQEVTLPRVNVGEISYRENNFSGNSSKIPGLTTFEPVILRKGSSQNQVMYDWFVEVSDDAASLSVLAKNAAALNAFPVQIQKFRKDIIISSLDRKGNYVKHWVLFDAFPISYKGGDDLSAMVEEKLIEEIILTYETFIEVSATSLPEVLSKVAEAIQKAGNKALVVGSITTAATFS